MTTSITFNDSLRVGESQVAQMKRLAEMYKSTSSSEACEAFLKQVHIVEGFLTYTYGLAASIARKSDNLDEIAGIWEEMGRICNVVLDALRNLQNNHEYCGMPELYDLTLDYKLACDKRYKQTLEERSCRSKTLPPNLFPSI